MAWKRLDVADVQLDVPGRKVAIGQIALHDPQFVVERASDGGINVTRWMMPRPRRRRRVRPARPVAEAVGKLVAAAPWQVALAQLSVDGGQVFWRDEAAPGSTAADPVQLDVACVARHRQRLELAGGGSTQAQVQLSAQVADPAATGEQRRVRGGSIDWKGRVVAAPLAVRGALRIERFPVHAVERYASGGLNASVQRGQAQWRGDVALRQRPGGIEANVAGDLLLADLHVFSKDPTTRAVSPDELIGWQALSRARAEGARSHRRHGRASTSTRRCSATSTRSWCSTKRAASTCATRRARAPPPTPPGGFAVGRQIAPAPPAEAASAPAAEPPDRAASAADAAGQHASLSGSAAGRRQRARRPSGVRAKMPVDVSVGGLQLVNGRVDYTDRLIKPNFSAELSELNGRLGAFRSDSREMATLELHGRVAGTGLLDIQRHA